MRGHGGDVIWHPTPGGGATFEVQFPVDQVAADRAHLNVL
jgi:signal transduction histidine kinase